MFKQNRTTRNLFRSPRIQRALEPTQVSYENKSQDDNSEIGLESRQPKLGRVVAGFWEKWNFQKESRDHESNCRANNLLTFRAKLIALKLSICVWDVCVCVLSRVWLFVTQWTVAHQGSRSMKFSMQEYQSGLPFPTLENCLNPGIESESLGSSALAGGFFLSLYPQGSHKL